MICTDPIYKWLPTKNPSVSIKISPTILISFDNSKESLLSHEVSWAYLRRLATFSNSYSLKDECYYHCLSNDTTIIVSYQFPIIGKQVAVFLSYIIGYLSNSMTC